MGEDFYYIPIPSVEMARLESGGEVMEKIHSRDRAFGP